LIHGRASLIIHADGAFIIERSGTDLDDALARLNPNWQKHIHAIHQQIKNDVSSTKIRAFLNKDLSIRYLVPEPVSCQTST
jgi:nicotinamide mononucleotide adenylyltransferase